MNPKLCIDARMIFSSGIGTYLRNIIPYMESIFTTTLLVRKEEKKSMEKRFSSDLVIVDSPIYSIQEQIALSAKIPSSDLFWSPHYNIPLGPIRTKKRIVTIHDLCHLALPQCFPRSKRVFSSFFLRQALKRSDLILTGSKFSSNEIIKTFSMPKEKIHVVGYGIEKKREGEEKTCASLGLNRPFLLYVGNLKPHKNIERLLEAFEYLPSCYELILAGRIFSNRSFLSKNPRVRILGEVEEGVLSFLYKKARALIQPSLYEGLGLPPLEAMGFGCPVIASKIGGLLEACGEAAFYIDPLSVQSIYHGMKEVLENGNLRERLIQEGFARQAFFSWEISGNFHRELFLKEVSL